MEKPAPHGECSTTRLPREKTGTLLSKGATNTTCADINIAKSAVAVNRNVTFEDLDINNQHLIKLDPNDFEDGLEYTEEFLYPSTGIKEDNEFFNEIFQDENDTSSREEIRSDQNSKRKKNHRKKIVTLAQIKSYPQSSNTKSGRKSKRNNVDLDMLKIEAKERLAQLEVSINRLSQRSINKILSKNEHVPKKSRTKLSKAPKKSNNRSSVIQPSSSSSSVFKSSKRTWTCKDCQETFPKKEELRIHRREYHPVERRSTSSNEKNITTCDKCGKSFSRPSGLKYHQEHVHIDEAEKELIERKYVCDTCGKKFLKKSHLMFHNQSHTGIKLFPCRKGCGKSFQGSTGRKRHEEKCNGEPCEEESTQEPKALKIRKPKKTRSNSVKINKNKNPKVRTSDISPEEEFTRKICQFCEREFKLPSQCQRHERIHTGEKIHKCTYENCTAKFSQAVSLKDHISSIHTGEYLECPYEECEHKFLKSLNLKYHIKVKHEQKKSICSTCGREYPTKANLIRHEMIHKGMKPFVCSICGMAFRFKFTLTKHVKTHLNPERRVRRPKRLVDVDEVERSPKKRKESKVPKPNDKEKRIYSYDKHFYCNIENCSKGFATKRSMVVHIKNWHGLADAENVGPGYVPRKRERNKMRISSQAAATDIRSVKHQERQETFQGFVPPLQPALQLSETPQLNYSQQLTSSYQCSAWQQNLSLFPPYQHNQQHDLAHAPPPTHGYRHPVSQSQWNNANPTCAQTTGETTKIDCSETESSAMSETAVFRTSSVVDDWENESHIDNDNDFHSGDFSGSDNETPEITLVKLRLPDQSTLASTSQSLLKPTEFQIPTGRQFKCTVCGRKYRSELDLSIHVIVHNRPQDSTKDDRIASTGDTHRKMDSLRRNPRPRTALPLDKLDCDICGETFDRRYKLFRHKEIHDPNLLPYKCKFCPEAFKLQVPLRKHNRLEHPEFYTKFQCHLCERGFASKRALHAHKGKVHLIPAEDMEFIGTDPSKTTGKDLSKTTCHICGKVCSHIYFLQQHLMVHDLTILPHSCKESNCTEKFRSGTALSKHVASVHPDSTLFRCNVCQLSFSNDHTLLRHKQRRHGGSVKTFTCKFEGCTRIFKASQSLWYHIKIVHKKLGKKKIFERPLFHTCDVCERNFERPWALRRHKLTHSEEKAFKCPEEGCGKEFTRRDGFNSHMKQHRPKKTFECPVEECGKKFTRRGVFDLHMKKKHIKTEAAEFLE